MFAFFRQLRQRWSNWCGDAEMERAIRQQLSAQGYYGGSAKLRAVRLAATQRPGWVQVYRFEVTARLAAAQSERPDVAQPDVAQRHAPLASGDPAAPPGRSGAGGDPPDAAVYHELFGLVREDHRHNQSSVRVFATSDGRRELFARWSEGLVQLRGARALA